MLLSFNSLDFWISSSSTLPLYHVASTFIGVLLTFSSMRFLGFNVIPRRTPNFPDSFHFLNFLLSFRSGITFLSFAMFSYKGCFVFVKDLLSSSQSNSVPDQTISLYFKTPAFLSIHTSNQCSFNFSSYHFVKYLDYKSMNPKTQLFQNVQTKNERQTQMKLTGPRYESRDLDLLLSWHLWIVFQSFR